jgi:hypothetical protein
MGARLKHLIFGDNWESASNWVIAFRITLIVVVGAIVFGAIGIGWEILIDWAVEIAPLRWLILGTMAFVGSFVAVLVVVGMHENYRARKDSESMALLKVSILVWGGVMLWLIVRWSD